MLRKNLRGLSKEIHPHKPKTSSAPSSRMKRIIRLIGWDPITTRFTKLNPWLVLNYWNFAGKLRSKLLSSLNNIDIPSLHQIIAIFK
jgi:hypothetical protein